MLTLLHPKLVHIPIALAVLMPLISGGLLTAWLTGFLPRRAWLVGAALQAVLVVGALASLRTGEADEDRVEKTAGKAAIEAHEEAAQVFTGGAALVLVLAILAASLKGEAAARGLAIAATVGSLAVLGLGYRTGEKGGHLVYGAAAGQAAAGGGGEHHGQDHDDD